MDELQKIFKGEGIGGEYEDFKKLFVNDEKNQREFYDDLRKEQKTDLGYDQFKSKYFTFTPAAEGEKKKTIPEQGVGSSVSQPQSETASVVTPQSKPAVSPAKPTYLYGQEQEVVTPAKAILEANKNKPFVDRVLHPEKYPSLKEGNDAVTHKMSYAEADGKFYAFPTVQYDPKTKKLTDRSKEEGFAAFDAAMNAGDVIEFKTAKEAEDFTKNYKTGTPLEKMYGGQSQPQPPVAKVGTAETIAYDEALAQKAAHEKKRSETIASVSMGLERNFGPNKFLKTKIEGILADETKSQDERDVLALEEAYNTYKNAGYKRGGKAIKETSTEQSFGDRLAQKDSPQIVLETDADELWRALGDAEANMRKNDPQAWQRKMNKESDTYYKTRGVKNGDQQAMYSAITRQLTGFAEGGLMEKEADLRMQAKELGGFMGKMDQRFGANPNDPERSEMLAKKSEMLKQADELRNMRHKEQLATIDALKKRLDDPSITDFELKAGREALRRAEQEERGFFDPTYQIQAATEANKEEIAIANEGENGGKTPQERIQRYFTSLLAEERRLNGRISGDATNTQAAIEQLSGVIPGGGREWTPDELRYKQVREKIRSLAPIVYLNEADVSREGGVKPALRNFGEIMTGGGVIGADLGLESPQARAGNITEAMIVSGLDPQKAMSTNYKEAIDRNVQGYGLGDPQYWMEQAGMVGGILIQAIPGTMVTRGLGAEALIAKMGKAITSTTKAGKALKILANTSANALKRGVEFEISGQASPNNYEELNFASGLLGGVGESMGKGVLKTGEKLISKLFGDQAQQAYGLIARYGGEKTGLGNVGGFAQGRAAMGIGESFGESTESLVHAWQKSEPGHDFWEGMKEEFGDTFDENVKFFVSTFMLGLALGGGNQGGIASGLMDSAREQYAAATPEQQEVMDQVLEDTGSGLEDAHTQAIQESETEWLREQEAEFKEKIDKGNLSVEEGAAAQQSIDAIRKRLSEIESSRAVGLNPTPEDVASVEAEQEGIEPEKKKEPSKVSITTKESEQGISGDIVIEGKPEGHFNVAIEGDQAHLADIQIGYDEESGQAMRGKGYGTEAYVQIGDQLAEQGVTLASTNFGESQTSISPQALSVWEKLVKEGRARITGQIEGKVVDRFTGKESVETINTYEFIPSKGAVSPALQTETVTTNSGETIAPVEGSDTKKKVTIDVGGTPMEIEFDTEGLGEDLETFQSTLTPDAKDAFVESPTTEETIELNTVPNTQEEINQRRGKQESAPATDESIVDVTGEAPIPIAAEETEVVVSPTSATKRQRGKEVSLTNQDFDSEGDLTDDGFAKAENRLVEIISEVAAKFGIDTRRILTHYNINERGEYFSSKTPILDVGRVEYGRLVKTLKDIASDIFPDESEKLSIEIESRAQNLMDAMERGDESFNADKNLNLLYSVLQEINDQFNGYVTQKKGKGAANGGKSKSLLDESIEFESKVSEALDKYSNPKDAAEEKEASRVIEEVSQARRERNRKLSEKSNRDATSDEVYDEVHDAILSGDEEKTNMPDGYSATVIDSYYEPIMRRYHTIAEVTDPKGGKYYVDVNTYKKRKIGETYGTGGKSKPKANPNRKTKSKPVADLTPTEVVSEAIAVSAEVDENPTTENKEREAQIEERIENNVVSPAAEKPVAEASPKSGNTSGEEYIPVFHGGAVDDLSKASDNLFVTNDRQQAEAYAKGNGGKVKEFKIAKKDIADEDGVRAVIVELGLQSQEEGIDLSSELMLHEILDPAFSTSLSEEDLGVLYEELAKRGYKAIEMDATDITGDKKTIKDILVLKPKETLRENTGTRVVVRNGTRTSSVDKPSNIKTEDNSRKWTLLEGIHTGESIYFNDYGFDYDMDGNRLPKGTAGRILQENRKIEESKAKENRGNPELATAATTETEVVAESPSPAQKPKKSRGKQQALPEGVEDMFTEARVSGRRTSWMKKDGKWFFRNHKPGTKISEQQFERDWQEATGKDIDRAERMAAMDPLTRELANSAKEWVAAWGDLVTLRNPYGKGDGKVFASVDLGIVGNSIKLGAKTAKVGINLARVLAQNGVYTYDNWRNGMIQALGDHVLPFLDQAWESVKTIIPEGSTSADIQTNVAEDRANEKTEDVKKQSGRQATTDTMREFSETNPAALNAALAAVDDTYEVMSIKGIFAEALAAVKKAGGFANSNVWADLLSEKEGEAKVLHHAKRMLAIRFYGELADQIQERMGDEATQEEMEAFEKAVSNMEVALDLVKNNNTWSGQQTSMMSEWRMVMANTVGYAKAKIEKYNEELLKSPKKGKAIKRKAKETKEQLNDIREQDGQEVAKSSALDSVIEDVVEQTVPKKKKPAEGAKRERKAGGKTSQQIADMKAKAKEDMAKAARAAMGQAGAVAVPAAFDFMDALGRYGYAVVLEGVVTFKDWAAKMKSELPNVTDEQLKEAWDQHEEDGKTLSEHSKDALSKAVEPAKPRKKGEPTLRKKIRDTISEHFKKGAEKKTLEQRLMDNVGLTEDEAAHIAEAVKDEFEARVKAKVEARAKALKRKPKKESKPAKTDSQRAIEAMVDGEFTDEMVQEIFADRLGLIQQMTTEQMKTARALGKALDSTKPNTRSEAQAAMALDRFMYEILPPPSNGELFGELFKSIIYANMLMGIPTHLKNLITSGAMTVSSFVETLGNLPKWKRAARLAIKKGKETGDWKEASWLFLQASPITELAVKTQALARGWSKGARIAWDIMKSGYIDSKYIDQGKAKLGRLSPILERHRFGKYNPANVFKYVGRALSAEDAWMYSINNEMELADATRRHFLDGKAGGPMTLTRDVSRRMAKSNPLYATSLTEAEADIDKISDALQMTPAEKARAIKIRAREILIDKIGLTEDEVQQAEDVARSRIFTMKRNGLWGKTATLMTKINNTKGIGKVSWIWMPFANIIGNLGDTFNDYYPGYGILRANGVSPTALTRMLDMNKESAMMSEPVQAEGTMDWIKKTWGGRQDQRYYEQMGRAWLGSMMMLTAMMLMDDDDKDDFIQFTGKNDPTHKNYLKIGGVPIISWELIPSIAPVAAIMSEAHSFHKLHPKEERSFGRRMLYAMGAVEQSVAGLSVAESVQNLNQVVGTALSSLTGVGNYGDPVDFEKGITTLGTELGKSGIGMLSRVNPLTNPLVGQIQQIFDPRVFSHSTIEQSMEYAALGATYRYAKDAEGNDRIAGVDIFGEEIKRLPSEDSFGFLSMFANEKAKDPRWKFLADHGGLEVMSRTTNANILFEDDEEKYGVVSRKMTDKQYGTYAKLAGQKFSKELTKYMNGNQWKKDYDIVVMGTAGTMTKLQEEVKKMASEARTKAKNEMDRMPESKGGFGGTRIGTKTYVKP